MIMMQGTLDLSQSYLTRITPNTSQSLYEARLARYFELALAPVLLGLVLVLMIFFQDREQSGWATFISILGIMPDEELDRSEIDLLLERIERTIHTEQNRVRYAMNNFVICVGAYLPDRTERAKALDERIEKVSVEMGGTACKVPLIAPYIGKIEARGSIGKKRKTAHC